ncbi:MAG: YHS domain-containing (seleno)protein [Pseudomonadota bacterium]|nr:YHS domain-containing (seleno)protein [Pseudomonadota bacterium]
MILAVAVSGLPLIAAAPAAQAEPPIYTGVFSNTALQGHDPVAYFTEGKPVKGDEAFTTVYMGAEFRFASAVNRDAFLADPQAYAPQYGGYCAWAMADGKHAKGDARHWRIVDGKLYLNYNKSIQKKWDADIPGFIERADTEWSDIDK